MILKVRDEQDFNLTMKQNIDCEKGFIELLVTAWDKKAHTTETRVFSAEKFRDALDYYRQKEVEMFNEAEAPPAEKRVPREDAAGRAAHPSKARRRGYSG